MSETRKTTDIVFRDDLYPRINKDPALVQRYAENMEVLPPIEVNQHDFLIDGWHRWTAYRKNNVEDIPVIVTETESELKLFALAIQRNATHGLQLNESDKEDLAKRLYNSGNGITKDDIARTLSVTLRTVSTYLREVEKQRKEAQKRKIFEMYLACLTQEEIAEVMGLSPDAVSLETKEYRNLETLPKLVKLSALYQEADFNPPLYTAWTFAKKSNEVSHYGNSEQRILDNLIYLYTQPFDIVLDPFAGGGATIDVCKKRLRRYWCSDRKPIVEREADIRKLDVCQELPPLHKRWSEVILTYLDPPYWKQAQGKYSNDPEDLANMPLEDFTNKVTKVVNDIASKQSSGAIAMLMQPTQWHAPGREVVDHIIDIVTRATNKKLKLQYRISCPYSTEQCTPQMVDWARDNKALLVITRELLIWRFAN